MLGKVITIGNFKDKIKVLIRNLNNCLNEY